MCVCVRMCVYAFQLVCVCVYVSVLAFQLVCVRFSLRVFVCATLHVNFRGTRTRQKEGEAVDTCALQCQQYSMHVITCFVYVCSSTLRLEILVIVSTLTMGGISLVVRWT